MCVTKSRVYTTQATGFVVTALPHASTHVDRSEGIVLIRVKASSEHETLLGACMRGSLRAPQYKPPKWYDKALLTFLTVSTPLSDIDAVEFRASPLAN